MEAILGIYLMVGCACINNCSF